VAGEAGYEGTIRLAAHFTVSQMLERDEFNKRYQAEQPIGLHELLYPLMQATTRWRWNATLSWRDGSEIHLLTGRELQRHYGRSRRLC